MFDNECYIEIEDKIEIKGGPGSGNFGHVGRPGMIGGSGEGGGSAAARPLKYALTEAKSVNDIPKWITDKYRIPPSWSELEYTEDPKSDLLVRGRDEKGRGVYLRTKEAVGKGELKKWKGLDRLEDNFDIVYKANEANRRSKDLKTRDCADCQKVIVEMGLRPGSNADTKAEKKAYGATTLEGRHVIKTKDGVSLVFVGKKGVEQNHPVTDKRLQSMLLSRANRAGKNGKLFSISYGQLYSYVKQLGGKQFTAKNFRTYVGTDEAVKEMKKYPKPTTMKEYKKTVKAVATAVASKLGNTPGMALQSYINPSIFLEWRVN